MTPTSRRLVLAAALAAPAIARAQQQRPVTIVVPFAAGGSTDVLSRLMAERMTQTLGQTVLVENRAGGNTIVGAEYVARAQPDGNTLLMAAGTTLSINPVVVKNLPYKVEDFAPITLATTYPFGIITQNKGPADIPALVAAAKANPGGITYGTNGPTTLTNVAMLMVMERLGIRMQDVTYRGDAAALNDFVAGNLDVLVVAGSTAVPVFRNGQGQLIGWTSLQRMPTTPEVPTVGGRTRPGDRGAELVRPARPRAHRARPGAAAARRGGRVAEGPAHPGAADAGCPVHRRQHAGGIRPIPARPGPALAANPEQAGRAEHLGRGR
jgi:tripartite-type tricarboxylate transporter receptor subunit TctC